MSDQPDIPREALDDPCGPPKTPTEVQCLHCDSKYRSDRMVWRRDETGDGFWCCPIDGCSGAGFCIDIWPTDPDWIDEHGHGVHVFDYEVDDDELDDDELDDDESLDGDEDEDESAPFDDVLSEVEDPEITAAVEHDMAIINEMFEGDDDDDDEDDGETPFDIADDSDSSDLTRPSRRRPGSRHRAGPPMEWLEDDDVPF